MSVRKPTRERIVSVGGAEFKITLLSGTPPPDLFLLNNNAFELIKRHGINGLRAAYQKKDIAEIKYDWKFEIKETNVQNTEADTERN